jgi:hypothetical protein
MRQMKNRLGIIDWRRMFDTEVFRGIGLATLLCMAGVEVGD